MTRQKKVIVCIVILAVIAGIALGVGLHRKNNYTGTDPARYAGKWALEQEWFGDTFFGGNSDNSITLNKDGEGLAKFTFEKIPVKLRDVDGKMKSDGHKGTIWTYKLKKGKLIITQEIIDGSSEEHYTWIYHRAKAPEEYA